MAKCTSSLSALAIWHKSTRFVLMGVSRYLVIYDASCDFSTWRWCLAFAQRFVTHRQQPIMRLS